MNTTTVELVKGRLVMSAVQVKKNEVLEIDILSYLKNSPLHEELALTQNNVLSFHWANWKETCQFQKEYLYDNAKSCDRYFIFNQQLDQLKKTQIWLKNRDKTIVTTMYDLYHCYSDPRMRMIWFDRDEEILLSTETESGPYQALSLMRWIDKNIYSSFIHRKILTQNIQLRGFRVNSQIPAKCVVDNSPFKTLPILIHQISEYGIVLRFNKAKDFAMLDESESIQLEFNFRPFIDVSEASLQETIEKFETFNFNILDCDDSDAKNKHVMTINKNALDKYANRENVKKAGYGEFYIFLKYRDLNNETSSHRIKKIFKSFVKKFQNKFEEGLKLAS